MKRIIRNTLLSDVVGAAFCLIVGIALVLMYTGCSEDKSVAGGASEEPSGLAQLENITVAARAYYAPGKGEGLDSGDVEVSVLGNVFATNSKVFLTELDSTTMDLLNDTSYSSQITTSPCGLVMDTLRDEWDPCDGYSVNEGGTVQFEGISLKSPIVLLKAISGSVWLESIVDVRDSGTFAINALTHVAANRIRNLVKSGMSFSSARAQADAEIKNSFAFGDASQESFMRKAFDETFSFDLLDMLRDEFGETGTVAGFSDSLKEAFTFDIEISFVLAVLQFPSIAFERLGDSSALYYQECLREKFYYANLLASVFGYGECSAEKEGMVADITGERFELECADGSWDFVVRGRNAAVVNHTFGTMTDSRDGKTYKTVTIDLDGTSQTWMAENLKYEAEGSKCFFEESFTGEGSFCAYGRMYSFLHMLDSIYFNYTSEEGCVDQVTAKYLTDQLTEFENADSSYWAEEARARAREDCGYLFEEGDYNDDPDNVKWDMVADSLDVLDFNVCPDGWRVARYEDWDALFSFLRDRFGVEPGFETNLLLSSYGNPTGFGMDLVGVVRGGGGLYKFRLKKVNTLFAPSVVPEAVRNAAPYSYADTEVLGAMNYMAMSVGGRVHRHYELQHFYGRPSVGFVRCVKD